MKKVPVLVCYIFLFTIACVDPYAIPAIAFEDRLLVVEGFINTNGPTTIQLSRVVSVNDKKTISPPELHATIHVESEGGINYTLLEQGAGKYAINTLPIHQSQRHRIRIKTSDQKEYVSNFVEVTPTPPPIDSVIWKADVENKGLQFYLYTHGLENSARYYHWEYFETWRYHPPFRTTWEYKNGQVVKNYERENIYDCWITKKSTNIILTTSDRLSQNVVYRLPLAFIPDNSEKLEIGYRMVVKQYAIDHDAYDYLTELKKNSEQQGTLFDSQPSHLLGNIQSVNDPEEPVVGYVSAHGVDEKIIGIIYRSALPSWFNGKATGYSGCEINRRLTPAFITEVLKTGSYLPADDTANVSSGAPIYLPKICVDCREKGGTNVKPDYWPQ